jgi:hypothetical protein
MAEFLSEEEVRIPRRAVALLPRLGGTFLFPTTITTSPDGSRLAAALKVRRLVVAVHLLVEVLPVLVVAEEEAS